MEKITSEKLEQLKSEGKTIFVDFFANWCRPCSQLSTQLESVVEKYSDKVTFVAIDIEDEDDAVKKYGIRSIPNVIIFKGNEIINNSVGLKPNSFYEEILKGLINE